MILQNKGDTMKKISLIVLCACMAVLLAVGASALGEEMTVAYGTAKIDGVIDDVWAAADRQQLGYCKAGDLKVNTSTLPEDCTVYASMLYDDTALYFLFEITDNEFAFESSVGDWKNDSIYLYVDEIGDGDPTWTDQQAQIALIPEDGWEMIPRKGATPADYELAYDFPTATTCVMEFKYVPRVLALKEGTEFTVDFQYNDSVPGAIREYCLGWSDETDDASNNSICWGFATLGAGGNGAAASAPASSEPGNWVNTNFTASFDDPDWHDSADDIEFEDSYVADETNCLMNDGSYYVFLKNFGKGDYSVEFETTEDGLYEIAICLMAWQKSVPRATNVKVDDSDWVRLEFDYIDEDKELEQFITGLTVNLTKGTHKLTLGLPEGHDDTTLKTLYFDYFFFRRLADMGGEAPAPTELLNKSWDNIFIDGEMMVNGGADGWLAENPVEGDIFQLTVRGWSYLSTPITGFAYKLDGDSAVKSADYIVDRPDVKAAISEEAEGFEIAVDVDGLAAGDHLLKFYAIDANGSLVDTTFDLPFTIVRAEAPAEEPAPEPEAPADEPTPAAEEPAEAPAADEPAPDAPAAEPTTPAPAPEAKSGCGSFLGGGLIVLVTLLGSAWIAKRR